MQSGATQMESIESVLDLGSLGANSAFCSPWCLHLYHQPLRAGIGGGTFYWYLLDEWMGGMEYTRILLFELFPE